jgi:hypothetical protein
MNSAAPKNYPHFPKAHAARRLQQPPAAADFGRAGIEELIVPSATIVALSVTAAVIYGIVHDLFTAHLCVEYFTVGHPPLFATDDPVLLALGWGVAATWWVGLILGLGLALAARFGRRPMRTVRSLVRPIVILMMATGSCALVMGLMGYWLADAGAVRLVGSMATAVPAEKHSRFLADLWAHMTSYVVGFVGGLVVVVRVWISRKQTGPA